MIVMPSSHTSLHLGWLCGRFPGRLGHLYSPGDARGPWDFMPYALDNGRFASTTKDRPWDRAAFIAHCDWAKASGQEPRWLVVPDVVGDAEETRREWDKWAPHLEKYGWPLAMAVQDGMVPGDVPKGCVCFIGGTTEWKRKNLWKFCQSLARVHVGRINTQKWLWECHKAGAESCDGTGWYRGDRKQLRGLVTYLERSDKGMGSAQLELAFSASCGGVIGTDEPSQFGENE